MQERVGQQLADALKRILVPHGGAIHLATVHLCMQMRGVREIESSTRTTYWRGSYDDEPQLRGRVLQALQPARLTRHGGTAHRPAAGGLSPSLTRLYERAGLPAAGARRRLRRGPGLGQSCVYANFVASVDGVTALGPEYPSSGSAISGHDPAGRFVMGPLWACADVVLTEGGPQLLGQLVADGVLDELFLTVSPGVPDPPGPAARKLQAPGVTMSLGHCAGSPQGRLHGEHRHQRPRPGRPRAA